LYGNRNRILTIVQGPAEIYKNVYSTGKLERIEQSMVVRTKKGGVLFVGCPHPIMHTILAAASQFDKIYAIIGGLHRFRDFALFKDLALICPAHCTQHKATIKSLYPEKYVEGGVGRAIEVI
jgi:7,8-dihydropterin-6-yl-methyl-4-(beta-D-ribofuranosyl)aminobenzene 5'-phosphate synthase